MKWPTMEVKELSVTRENAKVVLDIEEITHESKFPFI